MEDETSLDLNFWASFADLMLSLVLVLCLILFLVVAVISFGTVNLKQVEQNQTHMVESIATNFKTQPKLLVDEESLKRRLWGISTAGDGMSDIQVLNELNTQTITFSDKLLFRPDDTAINPTGQQVLSAVGDILKQPKQLSLIREIQIQGHADTQRSGRYRSNTDLASNRAIAVFEYLREQVGIDPATKLMSATTFGEFKSVARGDGESDYSWDKLLSDNVDDVARSRNRRIEIVLVFKRTLPTQ